MDTIERDKNDAEIELAEKLLQAAMDVLIKTRHPIHHCCINYGDSGQLNIAVIASKADTKRAEIAEESIDTLLKSISKAYPFNDKK